MRVPSVHKIKVINFKVIISIIYKKSITIYIQKLLVTRNRGTNHTHLVPGADLHNPLYSSRYIIHPFRGKRTSYLRLK